MWTDDMALYVLTKPQHGTTRGIGRSKVGNEPPIVNSNSPRLPLSFIQPESEPDGHEEFLPFGPEKRNKDMNGSLNSKMISRFLLALTFAAGALAARADQITFTFKPTSGEKVTASDTAAVKEFGASTGTAAFTFNLNQIQDTKLGENINETGTVTISPILLDTTDGGFFAPTKTGSTYTGLNAFYAEGADITVSSPLCGGVCLTGIDNTGTYSARTTASNKNGSFGGGFTLTYISPDVTNLFGDGTTVLTMAELAEFNPGGSADSFGSQSNAFNAAHTAVTGTLTNGSLNEIFVPDSEIPEPGSLGLLGTGLLGLAGLLRSKFGISR